MEEKELVMIEVKKIHPHPDNPRKDLGDTSELAESIRVNGIMQNLTVMEDAEHEGEYTVLIGHRRRTAAIQAGLTELPCRIVTGLEKKEQISIMLEENMQRNDLTIFEQAQGFQMMLDLGDTEYDIAQKTGFSKTTIRHRLNIAKLDQDTLKKKETEDGFQMSLKDLYLLEKVTDIKKRNKILKEAKDSRDLAWKARSAADDEAREITAQKIIEILRERGMKQAPKNAENEMFNGKWETVKEIGLGGDIPERFPVERDGEEFFYMRRFRLISIIKAKKKSKKAELTEAEKKRKEVEKNKKQINELTKQLTAKMLDCAKSIIDGRLEPVKVSVEFWNVLFSTMYKNCTYISPSIIVNIMTGKREYELTEQERIPLQNKINSLPTEIKAVAIIVSDVSGIELADWNGKYNADKAKVIRRAISILKLYGFSVDEEDRPLIYGTHELYEK